MALTPKPDGTLRAIGLTPMTYRVWARARRQEVLEWEDAKAGFWDSAMRSSSALRAGVLRALANESAATIGMASATWMWDFEKFYDSVNLERLVSESISLGFCAVILYMSLAIHTSVRLIKVQGHLAEGINPTTGLVAGDTHAQTLAKLVLYWALDNYHAKFAGACAKQYIDDIAARVEGLKQDVVRIAVDSALWLKKALEEASCVVSMKKMALLASSKDLGKEIQQALESGGFKVSHVEFAKDLGLASAAGRRRCAVVQKSRLKKNRPRVDRIGRFARVVRKASKLFSTGVLPSDVYGCEAMWVAPTTLRLIRRRGARATGATTAGSCCATALAIAYGDYGDPGIAVPARMVRGVVAYLGQGSACHKRVRRTWELLRPKLDDQKRWLNIRGPVGAMIGTLKDQGWEPLAPNVWSGPDGQDWELHSSAGWLSLFATLRTQCANACGRKLRNMLTAKGWKQGLTCVRFASTCGSWRKGELWGEYGMLSCIACAGLWPRARIAASGKPASPICERCGKAEETLEHKFWYCEHNYTILHPDVIMSKRLIKEARRACINYPSFWLRGLTPSTWAWILVLSASLL